MAREQQLRVMPLKGFWADVGQPKDFLIGTGLLLNHYFKNQPERLSKGPEITGNVLIDPTAKVGEDCKIGPDVTIGPNVVIGNGVRLSKCVVLGGSHVKNVSFVYCLIFRMHGLKIPSLAGTLQLENGAA
jgi:mannose-1-phosphate guanylyltransferase